MNAVLSTPALMTMTATVAVVLVSGGAASNPDVRVPVQAPQFDSLRGSQIVFVTDRNGRDAPDEIYVMNADDSAPRRLTVTASGNNLFPKWSPDGRLIAFIRGTNGRPQVYVMNSDGTRLRQLTTAGGAWPTWSPDGQRIAFVSRSAAANAPLDLFVINVDGTGLAQLTHNAATDGHPDWSPDGAHIGYVSSQGGSKAIYVMNADGTAPPVRLTSDTTGDDGPVWSPDGSKIALQSQRDGNWEIYIMNADGTHQVRLTNDPRLDAWPSWSPDGDRIAFMRQLQVLPGLRSPNGSDIFAMHPDGSGLTRITHTTPAAFNAFPNWGPRRPSLGAREITVIGTDYAFGVPRTFDHGFTSFTFENRGKVRHEMSLVRLKPGVTLDSAMRARPGPERQAVVEGGGILLADPGEASPYRLLADLVAGRTYVLICTLRDAPDRPPHAELGMFASFEVK